MRNKTMEKNKEEYLIEKLDDNLIGKTLAIEGVIERVNQTGGPTVFFVRDGTGVLALKGFIKPGERAYPQILEGDYIKTIIELGEFNGELEGDIKKISKGEQEKLKKKIEERERNKAQVKDISFLVKDKILEKLKDLLIKAATEIRLAILQSRPIIVRHHNDTDGYAAGFVLERAIIPLIINQHHSEKAAWEFFMRAPSTAPYYELDDSIRDTATSLRNVAKFSNKMPLVIIADNGSTPEDLMAIKHGKVHGEDFMVIDHHGFDEDVISKEVLVHINPFLVGESGSSFSAGMLCAELSRMINPDIQNVEQIPALAGLADKIDLENPKVIKDYLKIAEKEGYSKNLLEDISLVIEYVSAKVRFMEVREYIKVLFGEPRDKQKKLVGLMAPHIKNLDKKGLEIGKANAVQEKIGEITLQTIEIENVFPGFGFFPKPGRAISLVHDNLQKETGVKSLLTMGLMKTAITIRATNQANFSMHELIIFLKEKCPAAFIEGGGHKNAGSITFLPNKKQEVFLLIKEFLKR